MKAFIPLILAPMGALASQALTCTASAPLNVYCCASEKAEIVNTYPVNSTVVLGCAADDNSNGIWFRNTNGHFLPTTKLVTNCKLGNHTFSNIDALPKCSITNPGVDLSKCNANCASNNFPKLVIGRSVNGTNSTNTTTAHLSARSVPTLLVRSDDSTVNGTNTTTTYLSSRSLTNITTSKLSNETWTGDANVVRRSVRTKLRLHQ
ncbi:hypothetical protein B0T17DRAFT_616580 [Bombardia bombarda]|uniref:Cyanovirin-N domain-containing protein n=1 Tax=Bombardia bombarda TaxID=252184 RepID=A0AA40CAD2_9PEZI|nr:hypothetical protein B0T17DRAFT_616580 [Bombardia bombarda]